MEIGRDEYAPDYKSRFDAAIAEGQKIARSVSAANKIANQRSRLEREVIAAARNWAHINMSTAPEPVKYDARNTLHHAVEALETLASSLDQIKK